MKVGTGMTASMKAFLVFLASCLVVALISSLCVLTIPNNSSALRGYYDYSIKDGTITWTYARTQDKLVIKSAIRQEKCSGGVSCESDIKRLDEKAKGGVECFEVSSSKEVPLTVTHSNENIVEDCIKLQIDEAHNVYWYGGAELYNQEWPINGISKEFADSYLSTDLPGRYGNVLERYWLSSSGVAIFVLPEVPLFVSHTAGEQFCLRADYNSSVYIGKNYAPISAGENFVTTELRYVVCLGSTALATHSAMLKLNDEDGKGYLDRPNGLPDTLMLKYPIWSTWARYKENINQSVVESYAEEILQRNFPNCQLEIDDGYETTYGDFTFDEKKFPSAISMVDSLHQKGFRVTTWVTPFVNTRSRNYLAGRTNGYFIRKSQDDNTPARIIWWNGIGAAVDFTNEDATAWYENLLSDVKQKYDLDSFKFDAGETSYTARNGFMKRQLINPGEYTTLYSAAAYNQGGNIMEMRSSWNTQSFPFYMRMMDKASRWGFKGLSTLIPTALTFGIIGYPFVLPDMVGGNAYFGMLPSRELYIRWLEITAFMPVIQFSITPWDYDEGVTSIARYYITLHSTFVYDEILRVSQDYVAGNEVFLPVSPVWYLADPDEEDAFKIDDEFLVGSKYLVAPIVREGERKRDIYLPRGSALNPIMWRDMLRQNQTLEGGQWIKEYTINLEEISWWERIGEDE